MKVYKPSRTLEAVTVYMKLGYRPSRVKVTVWPVDINHAHSVKTALNLYENPCRQRLHDPSQTRPSR